MTTASLMTRTITLIKESQYTLIRTRSVGLGTSSRELTLGRKAEAASVNPRMTERATVARDQTKLIFTSQPRLPMIRSGRPASPLICPMIRTRTCHLGLQICQSGLDKTLSFKTLRSKRTTMTTMMIMKTMPTNSILIERLFSYIHTLLIK